MAETNEPRYYVHTIRHAVSGKPNEYWVIDRTTLQREDEHASKKAAQMTADFLNEQTAAGR